MRTTLTLLITILALTTLQAQEVQKCCGTTISSFLLGSMNFARHNQSLYLPSDFDNAIAGNITHLYYRYGTNNVDTPNTVTELTISMIQNTQTSFIDDMFVTGLTPVLTSASYTIPAGIPGEWFAIELDTPFPYDPELSLIVDILFDQSENLMTFLGVDTPGRKISTGDPLSPVGTTSLHKLHDIGFDLDGPTLISTDEPLIASLHPNPATENVQLWFDRPLEGSNQAEVIDVRGRILIEELVAVGSKMLTIDVSSLASGFYLIRLIGEDGPSVQKPFVRD